MYKANEGAGSKPRAPHFYPSLTSTNVQSNLYYFDISSSFSLHESRLPIKASQNAINAELAQIT